MSTDYKAQAGAGGKNRTLVYEEIEKTTGSGYDICAGLTGVVAPTPSPADAGWILKKKAGTKPQPQEDGTMKTGYTQYDAGENFYDSLDYFATSDSAASMIKEVKMEDGEKEFGKTPGQKQAIAIDILHGVPMSNPTKFLVLCSYGHFAKTSGQTEHKDGEGVSPSVDFVGDIVDYDLTIPATAFPTDLVIGEALTIKAGRGFVRKFLAKAV